MERENDFKCMRVIYLKGFTAQFPEVYAQSQSTIFLTHTHHWT